MKTQTILGIKFIRGTAAEVVEAGLSGGLVVVPSAPVLVGIERDPSLREAVLSADLAITDSGLMVLLWWLLKREKMERVSGLEYLQQLLEKLKIQTGGSELGANGKSLQADVGCQRSIFWIMPTIEARDQNLAWLRGQGFATTHGDCYVAPMYAAEGALLDETLLALIRERRPAHIIIALGGGVQERLGWFLKKALEQDMSLATPLLAAANTGHVMEPAPSSAVPGIHCIGAAIGFLSGEQVRIPMWVDYLYLGWLWRSVSAPRRFVPRYWKAARLISLMMRYGAEAPRVRAQASDKISS